MNSMAVRKSVLRLLSLFLHALSTHFHRAAMSVLLAGNAIEFTVCIISAAGVDVLLPGVALLMLFLADDEGRERMCRPGIAARIMKWVVKCLSEVRSLNAWSGRSVGKS